MAINLIFKKSTTLRVAGGEGGGGDGITGQWTLRRACDVMSTGYYIRLMSH